MPSTLTAEFAVSLEDSVTFARLSGDYNPMHVDRGVARRTRFGGTVTHGIHLYLCALDRLAAQKLFDGRQPAVLSANFDHAVLTGSTVNVQASIDGNKVRLVATTDGRQAFSGSLELRVAAGIETQPDDAEFPPAHPRELEFAAAATAGGTVPIKLHRACLGELFPSLAQLPVRSWVGDLLATTHIVGMHCPGMHSVYSGFKLSRAATGTDITPSMRYGVNGTEKRMQLLRIQVNGPCLAGTIEAFFRPRPVAQRSMNEIAAVVRPGTFARDRVLVIGGSRGLGELTAKIAAAGGAEVTITYALGKKDAERIGAEVRAFGGTCIAEPLDVTELTTQAPPEWLTATAFSHVYFFASPPIAKNLGRWDEASFQGYTRVYVTAWAKLVEHVSASADPNRPVSFLYPSSVFVTQPEAGFAEYAVAKAAGEAFCDQLHGRGGVRFSKPRLPRMRTDQTSSLHEMGASDPFPVMLEVMRQFHA